MSEPLEKKEELIRYFTSGAKPREQWRVGTEYEKVVVSARDGRALPFSGPAGVEEIMRRLIDRYGYEPDDEHGRIIALRGERAPITIEPGGQIELSGEQCETIHCAHREFTRHAEQLVEIGHQIGAAVLGVGIQPVSRIDEIELLPKERYHIMYPYMARKGRLGQRMMKQTAGVQANLDYRDEADAIRKLRVSMGIVPLLYATFANSPISDGALNGYHSFRGHIWSDTDSERCGVPAFVFRERRRLRGLRRIRARRADVFPHSRPSLCQSDGAAGHHVPPIHGARMERAARDDRGLGASSDDDFHRGSPEEIRRSANRRQSAAGADAGAAGTAQGNSLRRRLQLAAWDLVKRWSYPERLELTAMANKAGLEARAGRITFKELALELLNIGATGLLRQRALNERGEDESIYLLRLTDLVRSGHSPASLTIENWKGRWNYEIGRLVEGTSYEAEVAF